MRTATDAPAARARLSRPCARRAARALPFWQAAGASRATTAGAARLSQLARGARAPPSRVALLLGLLGLLLVAAAALLVAALLRLLLALLLAALGRRGLFLGGLRDRRREGRSREEDCQGQEDGSGELHVVTPVCGWNRLTVGDAGIGCHGPSGPPSPKRRGAAPPCVLRRERISGQHDPAPPRS